MTLNGTVQAVLLTQDPHLLGSVRQAAITADLRGLVGDKHFGMTYASDAHIPQHPLGTEIRNDRQITIISVEEMAGVAVDLNIPEIKPEWMCANLLLQGIPNLTQLPPSTRLRFSQGAVVVVYLENLPCGNVGGIIQRQYRRPGLSEQFVQVCLHKRGLLACVERAGIIAAGDTFRAEIPEQVIYSVQ
jgi:MOSC domain-containing protein YiiM